MSRAVNAVVVGIAIFVLLTGSLWYILVINQPEKVSVVAVDYDWGLVDANETEILGTVTFRNSLDVEVRLESFQYEYRVNGLLLGSNVSDAKAVMKPKTKLEQPIHLIIPTAFVGEWLQTHVGRGERSEALLRGNATMILSDRNQTVGFESRSTWSTGLAGSLGRFANCDPDAVEVCVVSTDATWDEVDGATTLRLLLKIRNPMKENAVVQNGSLELRFAGMTVGTGTTTGVTIPPGEERDGEWDIYLQHDGLLAWWPKHVRGCERSQADAEAGLQVESRKGELEPSESPSQSPAPSSQPSFTPSSAPPPTNNTTAPSESKKPKPGDTTPAGSMALAVATSVPTPVGQELLVMIGLVGPSGNSTLAWRLPADPFESRFACAGSE